MGVAKIPWEIIFNDYIKGEWRLESNVRYHHSFTYEELAEKYGCHTGTITNYAAKNNWPKKKEIFQASYKGDENYYSQMAATLGGDIVSITSKLLQDIKEEVYDEKKPSVRGKPVDQTFTRLKNAKCVETIQRIVNGIIKLETERIKESDIKIREDKLLKDSAARRKEIERLTKILEQQEKDFT